MFPLYLNFGVLGVIRGIRGVIRGVRGEIRGRFGVIRGVLDISVPSSSNLH